MLKFVVKRLLILVPVMIGVSFIACMLFYMIPGDIVLVMLGQHVDPYTYANVRKSLGLDIPFWQNFLTFTGNILRGDLGFSYIQQRPVNVIISEALPVTTKLTVVALTVTVLVALPLGVLSAVRDRRALGVAVNTGSIIGFSMPSFLLALFLQLLFGVTLKWLPISGANHGLLSYILPGLAVGLPLAAYYSRVTRASLLDVLGQEYILHAIGRGLPYRRVVIRHGLRNALIPVLTQLGMDLGMFMAGAVLTETVFNLPGMGRLVLSAINTRDFPLLRGILILFAVIVVLVNLVVDLLYARFDPKMAGIMVREKTHAAG